MFSKIIKINLCLLFLASICFGQSFNSINVDGNKRISKESIIVFGNIEINKEYNQSDLNQILKDLYETNFFKEVKLDVNNNVLKISIVENPIIESLEINGITSKKLTEALLSKIELKSRKSYIESVFKKDLNLIKNIVKSSGYYFAEIKTKAIKNIEQNSIKLIYEIELGNKAKINEIQFIGDKKIKDRKLRNIITSEETRFWKFISNRIYLDRERINLDKRLLTSYYKNNGYYNVNIENSFVEFKNNGSFKLIFNINSGNKFTFNKLNITLPDDYDPKYFVKINSLLKKLENEKYSLNKINKILKEIDNIALLKQYEFIDAVVSENIIENNKLDITFSLVETEKFYVERINVLGNQHTLEEVIRNSFIVDEGDPYNEILFNKSINNLRAKNIFGIVDSKIKDGSSPNLKIIDINVTEKPTGEISLGAGVGTSGGTFGGGVKENNFLGKGIKLDTNINVSQNAIKGQFVYAKPNFNYTENTLFTTLKSTSTDKLNDSGYKTSSLGFSLGTAFEQYENLVLKPELSTELESLKTTSAASANYKKQEGSYFDTYLNYSLDYDLRNQRYRATDGYRTTFYQELPLISESHEIVNALGVTKYQPLVSDMVGKLSFSVKAVNAITDNDVRVSKRLFVPERQLRGFERGKVGPVENNDFIGGNYVSTFNLSTTLPQLLPSFQNTDISVFFDAANIWGVDYNSSLDDNSKIRSATGVALDLMTPIGPLNFSLSQPISKASTDVTESFRFNLGTTF
jgi:outer membrane protein insertion porin family